MQQYFFVQPNLSTKYLQTNKLSKWINEQMDEINE